MPTSACSSASRWGSGSNERDIRNHRRHGARTDVPSVACGGVAEMKNDTITLVQLLRKQGKQAGDTVRTHTWMTSNDTGTGWDFPAAQDSDPVLGVVGTSSLIDQALIGIPLNSYLTDTQRNFWFRYNEHVHVRYHITFWEPKSPQIVFS